MLNEGNKGTMSFRERMPFNFHDCLSFPKPRVNFQNFSRPGKKEFHDFSRFSTTGYTLYLTTSGCFFRIGTLLNLSFDPFGSSVNTVVCKICVQFL